VEILVYRENITSAAATANPAQPGDQPSSAAPQPQGGEKLSKSY
jgi:hypothetical protein